MFDLSVSALAACLVCLLYLVVQIVMTRHRDLLIQLGSTHLGSLVSVTLGVLVGDDLACGVLGFHADFM